MLRRLFTWFGDHLIARSRKTPYFHLQEGDDVYMERFWLLPYPPKGAGRLRNKLPAIRVHHFMRGDKDRHLHDHPWTFWSLILRGGYWEQTPSPLAEAFPDTLARFVEAIENGRADLWHPDLMARYGLRWRGAGSWARRGTGDRHRVIMAKGTEAWTVFITGEYRQMWGFFLDNGRKVPWRKYLAAKGSEYEAKRDASPFRSPR